MWIKTEYNCGVCDFKTQGKNNTEKKVKFNSFYLGSLSFRVRYLETYY